TSQFKFLISITDFYLICRPFVSEFIFVNDTQPTEIYTLSLHDALPIYRPSNPREPTISRSYRLPLGGEAGNTTTRARPSGRASPDRKSTRLNSSHVAIPYAVCCLKKQKTPACASFGGVPPPARPSRGAG